MTKKTDTKIDPETQAGDAPQDGAAISDDDLQDVINNAAESDAGDANAAASQTTDAETGAQSDPLTAMTAERDALKDQLLRALADTENMRRRSEREAETARKYGHTQFARDLVGAIDNLARALASAPEDKSSLDESVQSLLTGIELSWTEIQSAIENTGSGRSTRWVRNLIIISIRRCLKCRQMISHPAWFWKWFSMVMHFMTGFCAQPWLVCQKLLITQTQRQQKSNNLNLSGDE